MKDGRIVYFRFHIVARLAVDRPKLVLAVPLSALFNWIAFVL